MKMNNKSKLEKLFQNWKIECNRSALFDNSVDAKPSNFDFGRIEGMLLGVAIGDALGVTTEGMLPSSRKAEYGEIRDYLPNRYVDEARGFPSDDTQLTFWTLAQLIEDKGFVPENVAEKFANSGRVYGIGSTVSRFLRNFESGMAWEESGPRSAGNGALMRIAPVLIPHLKSGGPGIWSDTALSAMITHNDRAAISSAVAFVGMLWELLDMSSPPAKEWWIKRYVDLAKDLEGEKTKYHPRSRQIGDYQGPLWRFIEEKISVADAEGLSVLEACNRWYSGAYLLETVPSALYILMCHAHDPEEAIVRAVNDTKDNDTIASIVGSAVGALHGRKGFPDYWIENLSGRTTDRDDGYIFELIDQAEYTFWQMLSVINLDSTQTDPDWIKYVSKDHPLRKPGESDQEFMKRNPIKDYLEGRIDIP